MSVLGRHHARDDGRNSVSLATVPDVGDEVLDVPRGEQSVVDVNKTLKSFNGSWPRMAKTRSYKVRGTRAHLHRRVFGEFAEYGNYDGRTVPTSVIDQD